MTDAVYFWVALIANAYHYYIYTLESVDKLNSILIIVYQIDNIIRNSIASGVRYKQPHYEI